MAAKKAAKRARSVPLIVRKIEGFPIELAGNKLYTEKLLQVLDKKVRKAPIIYAFYNHGRMVWMDSAEGIARMRTAAMKNMKKRVWDKFTIYTVSNRRYVPDLVTLARRIAGQTQTAGNFTRAQNAAEDVKRDINKWTGAQMKSINRTLKPTIRKYDVWTRRFDVRDARIRKSFGKRIDRAKDQMKQKAYRMARDKRLKELNKQRAKVLLPLRKNIGMWQAKMRSFQRIRF
jgi:hypothetical protein